MKIILRNYKYRQTQKGSNLSRCKLSLTPMYPCVPSLAAHVMWRINKDTGIVSDSQLMSVDQLEDHLADLTHEDLTCLNADVNTFMEYWSYGRKQHSFDEIAHIFGIVRKNLSLKHIIHQCVMCFISTTLITFSCLCRSSVMGSHSVTREACKLLVLVSFPICVWSTMTVGPTAPSFLTTASKCTSYLFCLDTMRGLTVTFHRIPDMDIKG